MNPSSEPPIWMECYQNSLFQTRYTYLWISNPRYQQALKKKLLLLLCSHCAWHYVYWEHETGAISKKKIKGEKKEIDTSLTESPSFKWSLKIRPTFSKITKKPNTPDLPKHSMKRKNDIYFPIDFLLTIVVTNRGSTAPSWKK